MSSHDATDPALQQEPPKAAALVFFDATQLHWCPDVGGSYVPTGTQLSVGSPGVANPWRAVLGSLSYPTGEGLYTIHERQRHQEVQTHLELLLHREPDAFYFVVLDNASAHVTPLLAPFWQAHRHQLEPVWLPTYSPHLNLIERLWRFMRGQMTKNQFSETLEHLCRAVYEWLLTVPFAQFCSLMGIDEAELGFVENLCS